MSGVGTRALGMENVVLRWGGQTILDGTTLSVTFGALTVLVGPSGCGKTTLLRLSAGLIAHQSGCVNRAFARAGMVFQEHRLLPWRTAVDNVSVGALERIHTAKARRTLSQGLLEACGLAALDFDKYPNQLSGGMRARVAIARALAAEPDLLLLDEPFNGLDVGRRLAMQTLVRSLVDELGITAIFVTHDLAEAVRLADTLLVMAPSGGRIVDHRSLPGPAMERDSVFLQEEVARLLASPTIATSFDTALPEARAASPPLEASTTQTPANGLAADRMMAAGVTSRGPWRLT